MTKRIDPAELVSVADIADLFGVNDSAVWNWTKRYPSFPDPVATVARKKTTLYLRSDVIKWAEQPSQQPHRPRTLSGATDEA